MGYGDALRIPTPPALVRNGWHIVRSSSCFVGSFHFDLHLHLRLAASVAEKCEHVFRTLDSCWLCSISQWNSKSPLPGVPNLDRRIPESWAISSRLPLDTAHQQLCNRSWYWPSGAWQQDYGKSNRQLKNVFPSEGTYICHSWTS